MEIDWVTVAAQIANFLALVWLLQRVLYRPLTRALKAREDEVNRNLREAESARETAKTEAEAHRHALRELEDARSARLAAVEEEAAGLLAEMTEKAHDELAERRAGWRAQLEEEKVAFLDRLRRRAGEAFIKLARHVLAEMADEDLVDRIAHIFAHRLSTLDPNEKMLLRSAVGRAEAALIRSTFPLSPGARTLVAEAVGRVLHSEIKIDFREELDLECGIVLAIGSRHIGWTIGEHLDALEDDVGRLLDVRSDPGGDV